MAKITVRGLAIRNRAKSMSEALQMARTDDDVIWNGNEKDLNLNVHTTLRISGSGAKMKVPEHAVGMKFEGSGNTTLSNVQFYSKQICNAINIASWSGNLTFDKITSEYNTRKLEKAYPTIVGTRLDDVGINIKNSDITALTLKQPEVINIENTNLRLNIILEGNDVHLSNSTVFDNLSINANKYTLKDTTIENSNISGKGVINNITINKSITISGSTNIDNLQFADDNVKVLFKDGTFSISNTDLSHIRLTTNNAEILVKDNTEMPADFNSNKSKISNQTTKASKSEALDELNSLIGLDSVKQTVQKYINAARVSAARKKAGLDAADVSLNIVFSGSPGTGKTTVAQLMGRIMFEQGIMPTSKFVHTGRSDLVGKVIGETEQKTKAKVEEALGGILFIDEAYSLLPEDSAKDFGNQAVDTLTDEIEKHHNDLVVILAGYTENMKDFFNRANPGMKSRFSTWVEFPDYSVDDLYKIAKLKLSKQFTLTPKVESYIYAALKNFKKANVVNGNGRFVRTFAQEITFAQGNRITAEGELDKESLMSLTPQDINTAYKNLGKQLIQRNS